MKTAINCTAILPFQAIVPMLADLTQLVRNQHHEAQPVPDIICR